jgi:hypothetical protein
MLGMMRFVLFLFIAGLFTAGCGPRPAGPLTRIEPAAPQTSAALCSAEPQANAEGTVTMVGCPFIQQTANIGKNGHAFAPADYSDAGGAPIGRFTTSCERWLLGADPNGTTIIVDTHTGDVISHGTVHSGQPLSTLPSRVGVPLVPR